VATRNRNVRERTRKDSGYGGELGSPGRRAFMVFAGASAGATLLGTLPGCGGSVNAAPGALDPIWGTVGLATQIINSLQGITQSMFPSVDFTVTGYAPNNVRLWPQPILTRAQLRQRAPAPT
jgi:hypothetical protein